MRRFEFELRSYVARATLINSIFWYDDGGGEGIQKKTRKNPKQIRKISESLILFLFPVVPNEMSNWKIGTICSSWCGRVCLGLVRRLLLVQATVTPAVGSATN